MNQEQHKTAVELLTDFYDVETRGSIYFITEQACCLAQVQGKDSKDAKICEQALRLITKDDPVQMHAYKERTDATKYEPDVDYDTEQYEGKETDVRHAVADIMRFAGASGIPAEQKEVLALAAEMIASFYGMEEELLETA